METYQVESSKGNSSMEYVDTTVSHPKDSIRWTETRRRKRRGLTLQHPSEQRLHARHARYLPSRTLASFNQDENGKMHCIASVLPYATLRIPRTPLSPTEEHAVAIASQMERDDAFMQDDPMSELLRIETLRDMPQCLMVKRSIKAKLTKSVSQKATRKPIGYWKRVKYTISITFMKISMAMREVASTIELWYHAIKSIEGQFGSGVAAYFKFLRWLFLLNMLCCILSFSFIVLPQSLNDVYTVTEFSGFDLLTGGGFLTNTIMYYGFYTNGTVSKLLNSTYSIPSAYFFTLLCCYIFVFILLSVKVAHSYRKCYIETAGGVYNLYASKIFCGWDFGIASMKAASLKSASIYGELKEFLADAEKQSYPNCATKYYALFVQTSMTLLVLAIMVGTGVLLWILLSRYETDNSNALSLLIVPLVITAIMNLYPTFVSWLVRYEGYNSKRVALYVKMIRNSAMAVVVVGTLLFFWLTGSTTGCWQTVLAQELYRLILMDFIASIVGTFLAQMIRSHLYVLFCKNVKAPRFHIAQNTLNLIYNQTLFLVAFYFSPPMSFVIVIKMIMTFYIKKHGVLNHCEPPSRSWRAAQTHTLFLALAFLGMVGVLVTLGYVIMYVPISDCGPFRGYTYTWEVMVEGILQLKRDSTFWMIVIELARPAVGGAILIGMCVAVYYLHAKAEATKKMVRILREMLVLESHDKEFLLKSFTKVADEHWLFNNSSTSLHDSVPSNEEEVPFVLQSPPKSRRTSQLFSRTSRPSVISTNETPTDHLPRFACPTNFTKCDIELEKLRKTSTLSDPGLQGTPSNSRIEQRKTSHLEPSTSDGKSSMRYDFLY
ncbi:transmembrane channel-like protein 5 [Cephus cinctus]|uniref:Transmembrane channel-like protein 5 n=1 Tax=Cephus cinctus TaxID=211228 RepID=A0AAJ7VY98_CEPCN|nr:transmembrane channel-like protein 5 [Cephus cinctus]XP_024937670.1 transmembrane channel-like protein 5 [Cephus cinctus]